MDEHRTDDHHLIEEYLAGLRTSVGTRPDADDVVAELRDHLLASAEGHERAGASVDEAQRRAIADLGDADEVAESFARNRRGVPAVPTSFTQAAGYGGFTAAVTGLLSIGAFALGDRIEEQDGYWSTASQAWGAVGAVCALMATVSLLALLAGVVRRHGGLGLAGGAAIGLAGLGAAASVVTWAVPLWGPLVAASWVLLALATHREGIVPRRAVQALAVGLPAALVLALLGPVVLGAVGVLAAMGGAVSLGRFLTAERPVVGAAAQLTTA